MRNTFFFIMSFLLVSTAAYCDVRLDGALVVTDTSAGARYLGEIINDTGETVTNVKVTVTVRNNADEIIDLTDGFVDGYPDLASGSDASIPPGHVAPFVIFGDTNAAKIGAPEVSISYDTSESTLDLDAVTLAGDPNIVSGSSGTAFYGEIANNTSESVYYARIMIALKDSTGTLVNTASAYVRGDNYLASGLVYTDTFIPPGETEPFVVNTSLTPDAFQSYYAIITYTTEAEPSYTYFGEGDIDVAGDVTAIDVFDRMVYRGEIENGTDRDIYLVSITFISRDASGEIIDIYQSDVNGTPYEIFEGFTTDAHISPGAQAPFEVQSPASFTDVASCDYLIHYHYSDEPVKVETSPPPVFTLDQNYPNPFNPGTAISFTLTENMPVKLCIYNDTGQLIEVLADTGYAAGNHTVQWDASPYPSGVYFYELTAGNRTERRKMTLLK